MKSPSCLTGNCLDERSLQSIVRNFGVSLLQCKLLLIVFFVLLSSLYPPQCSKERILETPSETRTTAAKFAQAFRKFKMEDQGETREWAIGVQFQAFISKERPAMLATGHFALWQHGRIALETGCTWFHADSAPFAGTWDSAYEFTRCLRPKLPARASPYTTWKEKKLHLRPSGRCSCRATRTSGG